MRIFQYLGITASKDNPVCGDMENPFSNIIKGVNTGHLILLGNYLFPWQQWRVSEELFVQCEFRGLQKNIVK